MTQPRPTAEELVTAVRAFLDDEVAPTLEGRLRFHARVAVNVLDIVARELRDGPDAARAERRSLADLLGEPDEPTSSDGDTVEGSDVEALSRRLARAIRAGDVDISDPALLDHLRRSVEADLGIANPRPR